MKFWLTCAVIFAAAFGTALSPANEYFFFAAFVVITYIVLATAWNILGGYAGYVNFGTPAFFGAGAYAAVVLFKWLDAPLAVQIAAGAAVGGLLGFGVGIMTLRLRGIFFAIATVAVVFIMETLMINWRYVGGATGLQLQRPEAMAPFVTYARMLFVVMTAMAIGAVAIARYIQTSWIGRGLRAIRDSEEGAEANGVPTLKLKLVACVVSGALMGAAGAPMPMYLSFIEPASTFSLNYAIGALAAPMIGGTIHWLGPVLGAILLASLQQIVTVTISGEINVLVVGLLLVFFVVAAPEGILGLFRRGRKRHIRTRRELLLQSIWWLIGIALCAALRYWGSLSMLVVAGLAQVVCWVGFVGCFVRALMVKKDDAGARATLVKSNTNRP